MAKDQLELMAKVNKVTPILWVLGTVSGVMLLFIASVFVYQGLTQG
jgi:hypothetical protein